MPDSLQIEQIKRRRGVAIRFSGKKRKPRLKKPPAWLYPVNAEKRYNSILQDYVKHITGAVDQFLMPNLQSIVEQANREIPRVQDKLDSWSSDFQESMNNINSWLDVNPGIDPQKVALGTALEVNDFNRQQWAKIVKSVLGIDLFQAEPWLQSQVQAFVITNVDLIKSIRAQGLRNIEINVLDAIRNGERWESVRDKIMNQYNVMENRATLIARDQVGKLNGDLTKSRQVAFGIKSYIWRTSVDERVRGNPAGKYPKVKPGHNHFIREGKTFKWNEPPPDGVPGFPIQCRCYAEGIFKDLFSSTQPEDTE